MKKRLFSLFLTLVVLVAGMGTVLAENPDGSVPNNEDKNGFFNGVMTQYYDVMNLPSIGGGDIWKSLKLDTATTAGLAVRTNGKHTEGTTSYLVHKNNEASKNSFFYNLEYDYNLTKDALRHEGYIYLHAGTTPMRVYTDDGIIIRMDLENPNMTSTPEYMELLDAWVPQSRRGYDFEAVVETDGYYRYQVDYFNWGGNGVLRWLAAPTENDTSETAQAISNNPDFPYTDISPEVLYLYAAPYYSLEVTIVGQGTVGKTEPTEGGEYLTGTKVDFVPSPASGWSFQGFSDQNPYDAVSGGSITMNSNKSVLATFVQNPPSPEPSPSPTPVPVNYPLTVIVEGPGSALPAGTGSFSENSFVALTATADAGAKFLGWFGDNGSEVTEAGQIRMTGAKSVIARFEAPKQEVVVTETPAPQAAPEATPTPVEQPVTEVITEEVVVQAAPVLPKTGGLPLIMLIGLGVAAVTGGAKLRK